MNQRIHSEAHSGTAPENYERFFVPAIGRPVAENLIAAADLQHGESVRPLRLADAHDAHKATIRVRPLFGRYGAESGRVVLALRISAFDPGCVKTRWWI